MALPRFNYYGLISDEFPESSVQVQYGKGYTFAAKPRGPDQVVTKVNFPTGLFWMENPVSRTMDFNIYPKLNIGNLLNFYKDVRMYGIFELDHPITGVTKYRFAKPFSMPSVLNDPGATGGYGGYIVHQTEAFTVQLIGQPL